MKSKKIAFVFLLSFVLNFVWEYFHSALYITYMGVPITLLIILRAALFDAAFITLLYIIFSKRAKIWVPVCLAALFAVGLELFALQTGRWEYNSLMPIIPFLNVGLTPVLQLPLLYYLVVKIVELKKWNTISKN